MAKSTPKRMSKVKKIIIALLAADFASLLIVLLIGLIDWTDFKFAEPGEYETSMFAEIVGTFFLACTYVFLAAMIAVALYAIFVRIMSKGECKTMDGIPSILRNVSESKEKQIIEMLKTIAKPVPGKVNLNRAPSAQFLRALTNLGYIDQNITGPALMAWTESVTGYKDKDDDSGHFFAAYNAVTDVDPKMIRFMEQIRQIADN